MGHCCDEEWQIKHLKFHHDEPIIFVVSHWQRDRTSPSAFYMVYKWLVMFFLIVCMTLSTINMHDLTYRIKWPVYLTRWGLTMCTTQAIVCVTMVTICFTCPRSQHSALKLYKLYWWLHVVATDVAFIITTLYWTLVFTPETRVSIMNFLVHGSNSILMMVDLVLVGHPIRVLQGVYPIMFGIAYGAFSAIYYLLGGTNEEGLHYIYPPLDWEKPGKTLGLCVGGCVLMAVTHIVCWLIYRLKVWVRVRTYGAEGDGDRKEAVQSGS